jgi:alpha-glucosidase
MSDVGNVPWWRRAAFYQIYPRSFADGNGDGIGDLAGIRARLPYLRDLGIDAVWINPWYPSPMRDGGYDVADHCDIDPRFGSLDEAAGLIAAAAELGLRVLVDLVPNDTSHEHPWFRTALDSPPGSEARRRYHFRPGRGPGGDRPPTDWPSVFGGSAWTRVPDGEWYLHLYDPGQPDLNWDDPDVRAEFRRILRFWLDRGVAGFRVDVAHGMVKDPQWPASASLATPVGDEIHPFWDRPELHEITREWRAVLDEYPESMMVAEAWVGGWHRLNPYLRPDEYHQAFNFPFLVTEWDGAAMRSIIDESLAHTRRRGSIPTWVLSNHDVVRHTTRYALPAGTDPSTWLLDGDRADLDEAAGLRRARAAALLMLALPGSVYLYQGEELGLPEVHDLPLDVLDDPVWTRSGHASKGRDGCRVPIPWTVDGPSYGFGDNGAWLPQPPTWGRFAAEAQHGVAGSTLELYRAGLRLRSERLVHDEVLTWIDLGPDVVAFRRGSGVACIVNMGAAPLPLPPGDVLLTSGPLDGEGLPPDAAAWVAR